MTFSLINFTQRCVLIDGLSNRWAGEKGKRGTLTLRIKWHSDGNRTNAFKQTAELSAFLELGNTVLSTTFNIENPLSLSRKEGQRHSKAKSLEYFQTAH